MDTKTSPNASSVYAPAGRQYRSLGAVLTIGVALWFGALVAGAAEADTPPQTTESTVTYADLDVSTEQGARVLLERIDLAAKTACGTNTHSPLLPREGANIRACVLDAVDGAVARFTSPALATAHHDYKQAGVTLAAR